MEKLGIDTFKSMIRQALADVSARADEFSAMDAVCGDGDHGTAMVEALTAINESAQDAGEFKTMLGNMAMAAMSRSCGSTSTLIGAFFLGMSGQAEGDELPSDHVKIMFGGGLESVKKNTRAEPGDKTLMDALVPAVEALQGNSNDLSELFKQAAFAANRGAESTRNMKASFGRARNLGDRSIGSADPGAHSWACMFNAFSNVLQKNF